MDAPLTDRRLDARFGQSALAGAQAILRPGYAVSLVNLSCGGALIEGPRPLRPGARVHVRIVTGNRRLGIGAQVLRCAVAALDSRRGVRYRGALKFDHRFEALWEAATLEGYRLPGEQPALSRAGGHVLPDGQGDAGSPNERNPE
jgi:hypothetical protein